MNKKRKNTVKKWAGRLHLWLGLASGLVVFIVAMTGCIFVFNDEIQDLAYDWRKLPVQQESFISPAQLLQNTIKIFPKSTPSLVRYNTKDRPAQVNVVVDKVRYTIYFDPYSGTLLHVQNLKNDFFVIVEHLHRFLLLPTAIGKQIVGISTLIFVFMLITGILLWWPKKRKQLAPSLKVKWKAKWRRVNYDLHRTAGVYCALLAIIIAITGLGFAYKWMNDGLYIAANLGQDHPEDRIALTLKDTSETVTSNALDLAFVETQKLLPQSEMYFVFKPKKGKPIVTGAYTDEMAYDHQSNFYFHPQTGKLLKSHFYTEKSAGLKLQEIKYGIHTGQYFGLFGKFLAFFTGLFVAGLPVSGFLIWWGRRNKKKPVFNKVGLKTVAKR